MGRRKRKKKKWKNVVVLPKVEKKWLVPCNHPLSVAVGKYQIAIIPWKDFEFDEHSPIVNQLDVFIGLTDIGFKKFEKFRHMYKNPLLQRLSDRFHNWLPTLENLIVMDIEDGCVDEEVYRITKDLLEQGKNIGFGCWAGHGRTGWLLAKLLKHFENLSGDEAVMEVRERLCYKAVETEAQVNNLECMFEIGYYDIKLNNPSEGYYKDWLTDKFGEKEKDETNAEEPVTVVKDEDGRTAFKDEEPIDKYHPDLIEAWRKHNNDETLTEEEERLILEDMARYTK